MKGQVKVNSTVWGQCSGEEDKVGMDWTNLGDKNVYKLRKVKKQKRKWKRR